jgi:D-alanyl-D-alanine carboxypeptidase
MPPGAAVTLLGESANGFARVSYNGTAGWAFAEYLGDGSSVQPPPPSQGDPGSTTTTTDLNLRAGPGTDFPVLAVMPPGAAVTPTGGAENGFLAVQYQGMDGWAAAEYLGGAPAPATPSGGTATTTTDLNLRAGPSTADPVLLVLPPGASVTLLGAGSNGFVPVAYGGTSGWVFAEYLA